MQLSQVEQLARRLIDQHGLAEWQFGFNRRKRSMGLCWYERQLIELSRHFAIEHDECEVRDVILHEIAHALAGPQAAHGPRWKFVCRAIGARPERCGDAAMPAGRWRASAPPAGTSSIASAAPCAIANIFARSAAWKRAD